MHDDHLNVQVTIMFFNLLFMLVTSLATASNHVVVEGASPAFYSAERDDLIVLRDSLRSTIDLHSIWTGPPCHNDKSRWFGIACSNSHVVGISLDGIELTGALQSGVLQNITYLTNINLSNNALHGELPALTALDRLRVVSFFGNRFSGHIPPGYEDLPKLTRLELQDNLLNGTIPRLEQQTLEVFNVSYNFLQGPVPRALQRFPRSSYDHNRELCGEPVDRPCSVIPTPAPEGGAPSPFSKPGIQTVTTVLKLWILVLIALGAIMVPLVVILCFLWYYKRNHKATGKGGDSASAEFEDNTAGRSGSIEEPAMASELEFFDKNRPAMFDLDDLLRASAEMMGKGKVGTTYRATIEPDHVIIVKRLKEMSGLSKKEFVQHMKLHGRMRHENLVEVISFYYSNDEKLIIYENFPGDSLFHLLHDNRGAGRVPLNWATRLWIVKGIARGLAYLHHSLPSHKVPHANLKTSNILFLHDSHHPTHHTKLTDFGFLPLLSPLQQSQKLAIARTPEFSKGRKLTRQADVYCFGLVLLEVLTGQAPNDEEDLSEKVRSAVNNDWSTDILDLEILAEREGHEEMLQLIGIALQCTAMEPERRPKMIDLVKRIEQMLQIKEGNNGDMSS